MFNRVNDTLFIIHICIIKALKSTFQLITEVRNTSGRLLALSGFFPYVNINRSGVLLGAIVYTLRRLHSFTESGIIQYLVININYTLEL
jgi:hypothetical protein